MSSDSNNGFGEWGGYMNAKITKLEEQFAASSDAFRKSNLFQGISIYVNGWTDPSADELKRIMIMHGGTYHHYERLHTTYIIASNLPDVKVRNTNTSKIISPKWVMDCLREQRILDYSNYLLYTNQNSTQRCIAFPKTKKVVPIAIEEEKTKNKDAFKDVDQLKEAMRPLGSPNSENVEPSNENVNADVTDKTKVTHNKIPSSTSGTALTAVDPKFLTEFYNNSRLHHIATLGAGFKQYVTELREKHGGGGFPARQLLKNLLKQIDDTECSFNSNTAYVMHIDMDCFFVSVGLRKYPHLRGQPVAVTHSKGGAAANDVPVHPSADRKVEGELFARRFESVLHDNILANKARNGFDSTMSLSEIASCSYEARAAGIHNGMFVGQAMKLCANLKTIPYEFEEYKTVAFTLYDTIAQYTLNIEAVSCDEMYVELTEVLRELEVSPMAFVSAVREEVLRKTGCTCSAGVGANKLQARIATSRAKPDGQCFMDAHEVRSYMAGVPVKMLPGVGSFIAHTLKKVNLFSCGDLQRTSPTRLEALVGKKMGENLYQYCRGIDNRTLCYEIVRKSVSAEVNYGIRFTEYSEVERFLTQICTEVHTRLCDIKRKTKCITLKLMVRAKEAPVETSKFMGHGVCDNISKSVKLPSFTNELYVIKRSVLSTMKTLNIKPNELRGIGIQLTKLNEPNEHKEKENTIKQMFSKVVEKQKDNPVNKENIMTAGNLQKPNALEKLKKFSKKVTRKRSSPFTAEMLGASPCTKRNAPSQNYSHPLPNNIDREVFDVLPTNIRTEILESYRNVEQLAQKNPCQTPKLTPEPTPVQVLAPAQAQASVSVPVLALSPPISPLNKNLSPYVLTEIDLQPSTSRAVAEKRLRAAKEKLRNSTSKQIDDVFLSALPLDVRIEIEAQIDAQYAAKEENKSSPMLPSPMLPTPMLPSPMLPSPMNSPGEAAYNLVSLMLMNPMKTLPFPLETLPVQFLPEKVQEDTDDLDLDLDLDVDVDEMHALEEFQESSSRLLFPWRSSDINILKQPNCLELIRKWVISCETPEIYDVVLFTKSAYELVHAQDFDALYDPINYLYRLIKTNADNCSWHHAYNKILQAVQNEVGATCYGSQLYLKDKIVCDKCFFKYL